MEKSEKMFGVMDAVSVLPASSEKEDIINSAKKEPPYRAAFAKGAVAYAVDTDTVLNSAEEVAEYILALYDHMQGTLINRWENPYPDNLAELSIGPFHSHCPMNLEVDEFQIDYRVKSEVITDHIDILYLMKSFSTVALFQETLHQSIFLLLKALYSTEEQLKNRSLFLEVITYIKAGRSKNRYSSVIH